MRKAESIVFLGTPASVAICERACTMRTTSVTTGCVCPHQLACLMACFADIPSAATTPSAHAEWVQLTSLCCNWCRLGCCRCVWGSW